MREALELAERGRWSAAPNPTVGAVLAKNGVVVARGWHEAPGRDHAEIACLKDAAAKDVDPAGCTLAVTLEPCAHYGKTPPCADAIIAAGIRHVVIGTADANPVAAGGAAKLREAGVRVDGVDMGILEGECRDLIADFTVWQTTDRPYVILKMASTLDGRIAGRQGRAQRVTGEASRQKVMELRANVGRAGGAVLVGGQTLRRDDPLLTARDVSALRQPLAAVASSLPPAADARLLRERAGESVFFCRAEHAASAEAEALRRKGARLYGVEPDAAGIDLRRVLTILRQEEGCPYVLCEGGGKLAFSLLRGGLVDEFHLHYAPLVLGAEDAEPLFAGNSGASMDAALRLRLCREERVGGDIHLVFRPERN